MALGSDSTFKDGKLNINANKWLQPIKRDYLAIEAEYKRFGPMKIPINKEENRDLYPLITRWHRTVKEARTFFKKNIWYIYAPEPYLAS